MVAAIAVVALGLQWARRFGGFDMEKGKATFVLADGYAVAGSTSSFNGNQDTGWVGDEDNANVHYDAFLLRTGLDGQSG